MSHSYCVCIHIYILRITRQMPVLNFTPSPSIHHSLGTFGDILVVYTTLQQSAEAGSDFTSAIGDEIIIPDGSSFVYIPINITADTLPELNETFQLVLNEVMLDTGIGDSSLGGPLLGRITTTDIVIFENDDPYGRFHITGSSGESTVREQEAASVGVSLTVERRGGTVGSVQVTWSVTGGIATEGEDFAGQLLSGTETVLKCII